MLLLDPFLVAVAEVGADVGLWTPGLSSSSLPWQAHQGRAAVQTRKIVSRVFSAPGKTLVSAVHPVAHVLGLLHLLVRGRKGGWSPHLPRELSSVVPG